MVSILKNLFSSSYYMPHGHCYLWQTPLVGLHVISDLLIAVAYFSIPTLLIYFVYRRRDVPFLGIFALFGAFIVLCGIGHLLEIWTLWHPTYWLSGLEKALTALISCYTAGQMVTLLPQFLSLKTPEQLEAINQELQREVLERQKVEFALRQAYDELELRVAERTGELTKTNAILASEIQERSAAEFALQESKIQLQQQLKLTQLTNKMLERIRSSLDLELVLQTAVDEVRNFLQVDRTVIYQFNPDWSGFVTVESVSDKHLSLQDMDIQDLCFGTKYVSLYKNGRIRAISDVENSELHPCHIQLLSRLQIKANLVLPILPSEETTPTSQSTLKNQLWGLLIAHHCSDTRSWQDSEVECLKQVSLQLAISLQQCHLFNQAQTELKERKQVEAALRQSEAREREKSSQLEMALFQLQNTQAQIVQNEKMASLGQMVAGVAHEINNPVSFIYGNITPALQYTDSLLDLIRLYQQHYPHPPAPIQDTLEEIDLEFVEDDFVKLLQSIKTGADRIREIVLSLRNFSRLDEADKKFADIHQGIESTLMILQHRLKPQAHRPAIEVIKDYGNLPLIECYAGQLNQVLMNLFCNAIDALEEKLELDHNFIPTIQIYTEILDLPKSSRKKLVRIRISDNGGGIPDAVRTRIFDPFFTTKMVGKGTGLGLSICHQIIVDKHQGKLECSSRLGEGTEFCIELKAEIEILQCDLNSYLIESNPVEKMLEKSSMLS
jgi:signal transduction histidine kinase